MDHLKMPVSLLPQRIEYPLVLFGTQSHFLNPSNHDVQFDPARTRQFHYEGVVANILAVLIRSPDVLQFLFLLAEEGVTSRFNNRSNWCCTAGGIRNRR